MRRIYQPAGLDAKATPGQRRNALRANRDAPQRIVGGGSILETYYCVSDYNSPQRTQRTQRMRWAVRRAVDSTRGRSAPNEPEPSSSARGASSSFVAVAAAALTWRRVRTLKYARAEAGKAQAGFSPGMACDIIDKVRTGDERECPSSATEIRSRWVDSACAKPRLKLAGLAEAWLRRLRPSNRDDGGSGSQIS